MKTFALFLICIICFSNCKAQPAPERHYIDMVMKGNRLYALTKSGHINIFNSATGKLIDTNIHTDTAITAMALDRHDHIIVADQRGKISILNDMGLTFSVFSKAQGAVCGMVFDSKNDLYAITQRGIIELKKGALYTPDSTLMLNHQVRGWLEPSAFFMDSQDRIWVGANHGEWGGSLYVFDVKTKRFIKPNMNGFDIALNPVNTIFSDGKDVYITFSLAHFMTSGAIVKFTGDLNAVPIIQSKMGWKDTTMVMNLAGSKAGAKPEAVKVSVQGEYIGPAAINPGDSCIYFYSQNGIFKGNPAHDLSKITQWTKIASPNLIWTAGQRNAVGPANNMLKMAFAQNGKLYFVSQSDGIGMIDGGRAVILK